MTTSSYDYARLVAAFGIVIFHAGAPGAAIGYAALPFFLMLIISLGWVSAAQTGFPEYIINRIKRLLNPWLVWSTVYGLLKLAEVALSEAVLADEFAPYMLLTGPAIHLWFLPFALVVCLILWPIARGTALPVCIAAFVIALVLQAFNQNQDLPIPLAQWVYVAPAVCLGFCLATTPHNIIIISIFVGISFVFGWTEGLPQITLAALSLIVCKLITIPQTSLSKALAEASMGVYLIHPLVFSIFERGLQLNKGNILTALLAAVASLCIALLLLHKKGELPLKRGIRSLP